MTRITREFGDNRFEFTVDADGYTRSVRFQISESHAGLSRSSSETTAQSNAAHGGGRPDTDDGGHMAGHRFSEDQGDINQMAQDSNLNRGAYKKWENEMADWTARGYDVEATVHVHQPGGNRPDTIEITYVVSDASGNVVHHGSRQFDNESGESFTRQYGRQMDRATTLFEGRQPGDLGPEPDLPPAGSAAPAAPAAGADPTPAAPSSSATDGGPEAAPATPTASNSAPSTPAASAPAPSTPAAPVRADVDLTSPASPADAPVGTADATTNASNGDLTSNGVHTQEPATPDVDLTGSAPQGTPPAAPGSAATTPSVVEIQTPPPAHVDTPSGTTVEAPGTADIARPAPAHVDQPNVTEIETPTDGARIGSATPPPEASTADHSTAAATDGDANSTQESAPAHAADHGDTPPADPTDLDPPSGDAGSSSTNPPDPARVYSVGGNDHATQFAPEQLGGAPTASAAADAALGDASLFARHGIDPAWTRDDLIDAINTPYRDLTPEQSAVLREIRDLMPSPQPGEVIQKVITRDQVDAYLSGNVGPGRLPNGIGGASTRAVDTTHLDTPADLYEGLRLDYRTFSEADGRYHDSPFNINDRTTTVIRYVANGTPNVVVPRHSSMGGNGDQDNWKPPFTSNGFTAAPDSVVPEVVVGATMENGAEMWEITETGTQRLTAVLVKGKWVQVDR